MVEEYEASLEAEAQLAAVRRLPRTLKTLRMAHVAALKGSRYRVLDEDGYDTLAPAVGGVLPALVDDLSEKSRRDLGTGVTRNLQVVAEAATGAVLASHGPLACACGVERSPPPLHLEALCACSLGTC